MSGEFGDLQVFGTPVPPRTLQKCPRTKKSPAQRSRTTHDKRTNRTLKTFVFSFFFSLGVILTYWLGWHWTVPPIDPQQQRRTDPAENPSS